MSHGIPIRLLDVWTGQKYASRHINSAYWTCGRDTNVHGGLFTTRKDERHPYMPHFHANLRGLSKATWLNSQYERLGMHYPFVNPSARLILSPLKAIFLNYLSL